MRFWTIGVVAVFGLVSVLTGCGGGGSSGPTMKTVKGVVTYNAQPVAGATVSFVLAESSFSGSGETDASGNFSFEAPVGTNGISIKKVKMVGTGVMEKQPSTDPAKPESVDVEVKEAKHELPTKYAVVTSSGLKEEVKKDGPNEFKFDLKD